jgi:hypothetical protein
LNWSIRQIESDNAVKSKGNKQFLNLGFKKARVALAVFVAVVQLCLAAMPLVAEADSASGVSLSVEVDDKLVAGEFFTVKATVTNNTDADISNASLYVGTSDKLNMLGKNPSDGVDIAKGKSHTFTLELMYTGNPDFYTINFRCNYNGDSYVIAERTVYFASKDTTPPSTPDITKAEPVLKVKSDIPMPVFEAGQDATLKILIVNDSIYTAKNARIALDTSNVNALPFTFDQAALVDSIEEIKGNEEEEVSFNIKIKPDAKEGLYPLVLNFQYYNVYNNKYALSETISIIYLPS